MKPMQRYDTKDYQEKNFITCILQTVTPNFALPMFLHTFDSMTSLWPVVTILTAAQFSFPSFALL